MEEKKTIFELDGGRQVEIATGKLAGLADGSVTVRQGDTIVLVAACGGPPRAGADFFPLQVDYREKFSAAGRIPGGYIKREGRPSDNEILVCRMTDRPIRPLFPKGYFNEVQIQALVLSADDENNPDVLAMVGASAALSISSLPFKGGLGALRVGMVNGEFVANPTHSQMKESSLELIYAGLPGNVIMIEGDADECSEETLRDALVFADSVVTKQVDAINELVAVAGKEKKTPKLYVVPEEVEAAIKAFCEGKMEQACFIHSKEERINALNEILAEMSDALTEQFPDVENLDRHMKSTFEKLEELTVRKGILEKQMRSDGRGIEDLRPLSAEAGILPRTHGSGLFSRGETQALVQATFGTKRDAIRTDTIIGDVERKFYLHYNFPNFSVGEVGRIMGPGRREIGHGNLAERSVAKVIPKDIPYTIRCVSEVMSSNGSTSMASVCGATIALMDAGVKIKAPVAGISCGLVTGENGETLLLTDILGSEDHYGDMDFKISGTREGITGFQLDLKIPGISIELLYEAMGRNKTARFKILDVIEACISSPREDLSPYAPRIESMQINPEKIGALIGPGGKIIKGIQEETGATIEVDDTGLVNIFAANAEALEKALEMVGGVAAEPEIGKIYRGKVISVKEFGAFVEILPGQEGLLHISELADYRVERVSDICKEGDMVTVKVLDVDDRGKIRLSRKAALEEIG
jgi:polyribonucleotide nucleotidyltransferase